MAVEFALAGDIVLNGKTFTSWSTLRAHLSKSIANASISSSSSLRGEVQKEDEKQAMQSLLATALSKATGKTRTLMKGASIPVTEDDIIQNVCALKSEIVEFKSQNPPGRRLQFHPAAGGMMLKCHEAIDAFKEENGGVAHITLAQLMTMIARCCPVKIAWTNLAAELCEFTLQQGGFPGSAVVEELFVSKEAAEVFGCMRASYVIHTLHALFCDEASELRDFVKHLAGFADVVKLLAKPGQQTERLQLMLGRWDMSIKARSVEIWSDEWSKQLELFMEKARNRELDYNSVYTCFLQVVFKGKLATAAEKCEFKALEESQSSSGPKSAPNTHRSQWKNIQTQCFVGCSWMLEPFWSPCPVSISRRFLAALTRCAFGLFSASRLRGAFLTAKPISTRHHCSSSPFFNPRARAGPQVTNTGV